MKAKGWKEMPIGGIILDAGNSVEYETGSWRSLCPVLDKERCNHCMLCWVYCPDGSVFVKDDKVVGFNLEYCKGCGICARECPRKAIAMVEDAEVKGGI